MALYEQEQQAKQELGEALSQLTQFTPDSLIRTNALGTSLDFSSGVDVFERTLRLFRDLKEASLDNVPQNILNQLKTSTDQAAKNFKNIQEFDPSGQNNPAQIRDSLIQQVASQYQDHFASISPIIAYSVRKGTDFEQLETNARRTVSEIQKIQQDLEEKGQAIVAETESTLEQVRKAAAEVGVAQHAIHFKNEASSHLKLSKSWLIVTLILAFLTLGYGAFNVWYYSTHILTLSSSQAIQLGISKLVIFAVLYFGVVWSGKIYKAQQHNYVVNRHRQNALSTFETFVKAAGEDQTKNAVLIQATQSIFSPQISGFTTQESEPTTSPRILEIIRSVVGASK